MTHSNLFDKIKRKKGKKKQQQQPHGNDGILILEVMVHKATCHVGC
jgi:hypothetical protein